MTRFGRDPEAIMRDLVIALAHPDYRDDPPIDSLRRLKRERGGVDVNAHAQSVPTCHGEPMSLARATDRGTLYRCPYCTAEWTVNDQ